MSESVTNSASELRVLEVISESTTNNINGALTIIWSNEWSDIINYALSIVMEVSKALFDSFKLDCKWN